MRVENKDTGKAIHAKTLCTPCLGDVLSLGYTASRTSIFNFGGALWRTR